VTRIVLHALEGVQPPVVARVSGDPELLRDAAAGLPDCAATPEAIAARVRRAGGEVVWGDTAPETDAKSRLRFCRARGASSLALVRADPSLLPGLQLGSYFEAHVFRRLLRRALLAARLPIRASPALAADVAFWSGARSAATASEWRRLTRSSYVVVFYHRIAGDRKPGQERLDVSPEVFERHMRWLRRLKLQPIAVDQLIAFHTDPQATLPPRAVVVCADDGFRDAVLAFRGRADLRPILFVTTAAVGTSAPWAWADGEVIASWQELQEFAANGGEVASHTRTHASLPDLDAETLAVELHDSLHDIRAHLPQAAPLLAYPHGRSNEAVRAATAAAGYRAAFSTRPGRNGAGTDRYDLRRVAPKEWDGAAAFAWKALTGELVPWSIERWRLRVRDLR
jgi:peptidoglycan/xylan/chitin deacetylase (PgdA/CDA1 family)